MEELKKSWNPPTMNEEEEEEETGEGDGEEYGGPVYPLTSELLAGNQETLPADFNPPCREMKFRHSASGTKAKDKTCPEFHPSYDPRTLVEISLHLDVLKNFVCSEYLLCISWNFRRILCNSICNCLCVGSGRSSDAWTIRNPSLSSRRCNLSFFVSLYTWASSGF